MSDLFTAKAQRNITYAWFVGFFAILIGEGLGYLKNVPNEMLFTMTSAVIFFWFSRQRHNPDSPKEDKPNA